MYQRPPVSEPIPFYLSVFHSSLILLVEHYRLEFLDATYSLPLETIEHNGEQHIKNCSGLFAQVILLLPIILYFYYLLYNRLLPQE